MILFTITGVSMGGSGVWDLASRLPGRFAAIAPVCGEIGPPGVPASAHDASRSAQASSVYAQVARKIAGTPVWIFHGADDPVVPAAAPRRMEAALKAAGGSVAQRARLRASKGPVITGRQWIDACRGRTARPARTSATAARAEITLAEEGSPRSARSSRSP